MEENKQLATLSDSERFIQAVVSEYETTFGEVKITDHQKRLMQNYFVTIDGILKKMELKRNKDPKDKYYDSLEVTWKNINLVELKRTAKHVSSLGLDSLQKNNLSFIVIKDKIHQKYNVGFWEGYVGKELIAIRYAVEMPNVTCELIYSNDEFFTIKKDRNAEIETYEFRQGNVFDSDRKIVGGFYYYDYQNKQKNKIFVMSIKDILKRKPKKASAEFWGGEVDVWENGKKTGKKEVIDGWYEEMCEKTLKNKAFGSITLDPQKIDNTYQFLKQQETNLVDAEIEEEIEQNANTEIIEVLPVVIENIGVIEEEAF